MRLTSLLFGRGWVLLIPVLLGLAWHRAEDLRDAHQQVWNLTNRYVGVRKQMRQIRADAMSRVRTEQQR